MADLDPLPLPRTELARSALRRVTGLLEPAILNHSLRAYLYGRAVGERRGLLPDRDYDDELLFLGCLWHDAGLSAEGDGDQVFTVDGADLAARFLTGEGVAPERVDIVWDAVALHTHAEVALRKRAEIALVCLGAGVDLGEEDPPLLPVGYADAVHAALPRLHATAVLYEAVVGQALAKPHKAPPFTMSGELLRQHTGASWPTWHELMNAPTGWGDHAGYRSRL